MPAVVSRAQPISIWLITGLPTTAGITSSTDPNPYCDVDAFLAYRNSIFAGYVFEFQFDQPVDAKQFLETEIFRSLGGYLVVLADGRLSPRFFVPPYTLTKSVRVQRTQHYGGVWS